MTRLLALAFLAVASAFAPSARAPARATIRMAKFDLPSVSLPSFGGGEPAEPKGPIRPPNQNKGNYREVGKAGYKIGDIASLQASFCFVPLEKEGPRQEFWEVIAERRALIAAQKGSLPPKPTREAPSLPSPPKFEAPKF